MRCGGGGILVFVSSVTVRVKYVTADFCSFGALVSFSAACRSSTFTYLGNGTLLNQ